MNYKALTSEDLRKCAKSVFGDILRINEITDDEIIEELQAADRFRLKF